MLNQQTIEKLYAMRMRGMADGFTQQQEDPQSAQLSFEERFALLVDRHFGIDVVVSINEDGLPVIDCSQQTWYCRSHTKHEIRIV